MPPVKSWQKAILAISWTAFALWGWKLFSLSDQPPQPITQAPIPYIDKILHVVFFAIGGFLFHSGFQILITLRRNLQMAVSAVVIFGIGAYEEWNQMSTPGREGGDWGDLLADLCGGVLGILVAWWIYELLTRRTNSQTPAGN